MKVLQINATYKNGSTGRMVWELHNHMKSVGIDSYVACAIVEPGEEEHCYRIGGNFDRQTHALFARLTGLQGYFSSYATRKLISHIKRIRPDVVHLHNVHSNYLNLNMLLRFLAKEDIATCITLHDCWFYTGKCTHYWAAGCYKWRKKCGNCPKLKMDIPSWFIDRTSKMLLEKKESFESIPRLGVIGVSDWITREAKSTFLKHATMVQRIYNWIDLSVFYPRDASGLKASLQCQEKFIILGVAAGWSESKGINQFIELSSKLIENEIIILVGNPPEVELPSNMIAVGSVKEAKKLAYYYSAADVFLQLSKEESFGKVVAEALACGTPAIVYDSTANPELLSEDCGYVVKRSGKNQLYDRVQQVKTNTKFHYSKACTSFAQKNFNITDQMDQYVSMYSDITRGGRHL